MEQIQIIGNNGFTCTDIAQPSGFEFPETRPIIEDIPAREGAIYISSMFGRRNLSWQGLIREPDIQEKRRALIRACRVGQLKTIQFETCDGIPVQADIEVIRLLMPYRLNRSIYLIQAVAPDYRFFSQTLVTAHTFITESTGGTPVPAAVPAPIGGGSSIDFFVVNEGNIEASPVFTIRGPGTNFVVQNTTTGQQFTVNLTLLTNETVVIDTMRRTAFQGNQNVFGSFSGSWMTLIPGENRIKFNASGGTTANTRLTISFRSAWAGI